MTGNLSFGDNDKAIFGAGSDLEIFHDASHSWIKDTGTGNLKISAGNFEAVGAADTNKAFLYGIEGGSLYLYHNGNAKLQTTSTGIDVTGTVTADGLTVAGGITTTVPTVTLDVVEESSNADGLIGLSAEGSGRSQIRSTHSLGSASDLRLITDVGGSARDRLKIDANGDISFYEDTGTTPKFFWDASAERLGIGTTSPSSFWSGGNQLVVGSGAGSQGLTIYSGATSDAGIYFSDGTSGNALYQGQIFYRHSEDAMVFNTAASQAMRIDSSGNLLVGTTSGSDKVTVNGTVSATNFNTTSDQTLKTNVETLTGSLDAVKSLRGVSFDWLENGGSEIGVIAQEVEAVLPDVVSTNDEGIKSVKYGNMVAVLIEAIKEQQVQIDELKAKLGE
jgi:hypothetical protein